MPSNKRFSKRNKTLKNKISKYISRKQDICCEEDIDRKIVIQQIIEKYKNFSQKMGEPDQYLDYINNDLVKFIGYYVVLKNDKDIEGQNLWNEIDQKMFENKVISQKKIELLLLHDVPLYFLLSFLGYSLYKEKSIK